MWHLTPILATVSQCLSNTLPLREYFSTGAFHGDVNRGNPLGHEGKLAESFGDLMGLMWSEKEAVTTVAPRGFKYQMGRFAPRKRAALAWRHRRSGCVAEVELSGTLLSSFACLCPRVPGLPAARLIGADELPSRWDARRPEPRSF